MLSPPRAWALAALVTVAASVPGLAASWHTGTFFRQTDTRTLALDYFRSPGGFWNWRAGAAVFGAAAGIATVAARRTDRAPGRPAEGIDEGSAPAAVADLARSRRTGSSTSGTAVSTQTRSTWTTRSWAGRRDYPPSSGGGVQFVVPKRYNDEPAVVGPLVQALEQKARRVAVFSPYAASGVAAPVAPFLHNTNRRT